MTNRFVVFHVGADSLRKYYPLMEVSRKALNITHPGAEYIVLTDEETAPHLRDFHIEVLAPKGPLMLSYLIAQLEFCKKTKDGMSVLAATDCVANRNLDTALEHPVAITYRNRGISLINNIAYVHDHGRMAWFLNRALGHLPHDQQDWFGDQAAWEKALGSPEDWETVKGEIKVARPDGVEIHLYPCETHNYFNKLTGTTRRHMMPPEPYLMHFKGKRKAVMVEMVEWCILYGRDRDRIRLGHKDYGSKNTDNNEARRDAPDKANSKQAGG